MRILYVAKHDSGDNDDEGAIAHALDVLGHRVVKVHELRRHRPHQGDIIQEIRKANGGTAEGFDFCLFHKWEVISEVADVSRLMPCAFWYFDLISNADDHGLAERMERRRRWFDDVIPYCKTAFLTDGDWVAKWNNGLGVDPAAARGPGLYWLMQGMDERHVERRPGRDNPKYPDTPEIIFTGTRYHGAKRAEHIAQLQAHYRERFAVIGESPRISPRRHGRDLADLFASTKVVVAPDGPCTDRYWSNRVYLTSGLGGCLVHPYCAGLVDLGHYTPDLELTTYRNRLACVDRIDALLANQGFREGMVDRALYATVDRNLYRHRCGQLVATMRGLL